MGAAYGDELRQILDELDSIVILDPSERFRSSTTITDKRGEYIALNADGTIDMPDEEFDIVTSLGTLHHIPNVSFVIRECSRVLKPGGYLLLREPIVSMGDWRQARPGLTKRERGIPLAPLRRFLEEAGLKVRHEAMCFFPLSRLVRMVLNDSPYNLPVYVRLDRLLSILFAPNYSYHSTGLLGKLRPTNVFFVAQK